MDGKVVKKGHFVWRIDSFLWFYKETRHGSVLIGETKLVKPRLTNTI